MLFNSYEFIFVFLPVVLLFFYLAGSSGYHRIAMSWLVGASIFFYGWWNPTYVALITGSVLFNYAIGASLSDKITDNKRKIILTFGIAANLFLIGYFKYANFFVDSLNSTINSTYHLEKIILPLAISFFTFQQIAYLVDAYKGKAKEYNFLHYVLFVTFFPQLIAGPIVHHKEMMSQFSKKYIYTFRYSTFSIGLTIFLLGLFKKVVLADTAALYASPVFESAANGEPLTFFVAWGGALSYTFQLYFDFSGYSDMAIGIARMFGIKLPLNFNSPYKAVNIIEFWRRWHMTLSRFLRDYLYIPLGGSKCSKSRRYFNLMLTMLLGGLWHGAGWTFVAWGALHGIYLMINHGWRAFKSSIGLDITKSTWGGNLFSTIITFLAVVISWVFFRSETFSASLDLLVAMCDVSTIMTVSSESFAKIHLIFILILFTIVFFFPNTQAIVLKIFDKSSDFALIQKINTCLIWKPGIIWAGIIGLIFTFTLILLERESEFLYFQF